MGDFVFVMGRWFFGWINIGWYFKYGSVKLFVVFNKIKCGIDEYVGEEEDIVCIVEEIREFYEVFVFLKVGEVGFGKNVISYVLVKGVEFYDCDYLGVCDVD